MQGCYQGPACNSASKHLRFLPTRAMPITLAAVNAVLRCIAEDSSQQTRVSRGAVQNDAACDTDSVRHAENNVAKFWACVQSVMQTTAGAETCPTSMLGIHSNSRELNNQGAAGAAEGNAMH